VTPDTLPETYSKMQLSHKPSIASLTSERIPWPLLPILSRILLVLFRTSPRRAHLPPRLQLRLILSFHLLGPSPIFNALIPDLFAALEHIPALAVLEEGLHLLERAAGGFRVHENDEGDAEDVESAKKQKRAVADGLEEEGGDHRDDAVANGPTDHGPGPSFGTDVQRKDFRGIKPRRCKPSRTKSSSIQECHSSDAGTETFLARSWLLSEHVEYSSDE